IFDVGFQPDHQVAPLAIDTDLAAPAEVGFVELGRTAGAKEARVGILAPEPAWSQSRFRASPICPGVQANIDAAPTAHWHRSHRPRVYTRRQFGGPRRAYHADGGNQRRTGSKLCHDDPRLATFPQ